ncbi:hypothetical protein ACWEOW_09445 [Monashia sp. NPDC004114]
MQLSATPTATAPTADTDTGTYYDTVCRNTYIDGDVHQKSCDVFTHGYGVRWDGLSGYWKGVAGMGSVSSPPGAPVSRSVSQHMHWSIK